jgi:hypothetical protein
VISRSVPVSVPFRGTVPADAVASAVRTLLGDRPGKGVVRIVVEREVSGPGSELMAILHRLGFRATPGCKCRQRAETMDRMGCDWCDANVPLIVGWLREEATKRGLPFLDAAGAMLVRRAIKNAKKSQASAVARQQPPG